MNVHEVREYIRSDTAMLTQVRNSDAPLGEAVLSDDIEVLRKLLDDRIREARERNNERNRMLARLQANPLDAEAQAKIQEIIRHENVMQNLETAMEHNPESFGSVIML
jgi:DNA damage-inducible protein 1